MTTTHYQSKDKIVEVLLTNDDNRFPRHLAPMAVLKLHPQPHTRCRRQWGAITAMLNYDDVRALLEALKICEERFDLKLSANAKVKPPARQKTWQNWNRRRVSRHRRS